MACEAVNPIALSRCAVCALPFTARFAVADAGPEVDWDAARSVSMIVPGLGHVRAGGQASGLARLTLFTVWLLGGLVVLAGAGISGMPVAGPLLLGAAAVHIATQVDIRALQKGGREVLAGRTLLWLVVGVTVLVLAGAVLGLGVAGFGARPVGS
jgi:hypothetical protein